jgi:hypothetical protein
VSLVSLGLGQGSPALVEQGREHLRLVATLRVELPITDTIDIRHARMLLDSLELCPGYSRYKQQETDERKVKEMYAR